MFALVNIQNKEKEALEIITEVSRYGNVMLCGILKILNA